MAEPSRPPQRGQIPSTALLVLLVALTFLIPAVLMRGKSATFDEVVHLPAGYSYLKTGLFNLKTASALPLNCRNVALSSSASSWFSPGCMFNIVTTNERTKAERLSILENSRLDSVCGKGASFGASRQGKGRKSKG